MADLAKCSGDSCSIRDRCRRFLVPSRSPAAQPWLTPKKNAEGFCLDFLPTREAFERLNPGPRPYLDSDDPDP